jgi:hypothetical protein
MALRGTGFAKRPAGTSAVQASSAERPVELEPRTRAVPLDLTSLVAPYRRQGRISLRVERLPHRARLSRGQNNGDHSWSLSFDELDNLHYLAPKDLAGEQTLLIRVVSLDGGDGATVAVLELAIPAAEIPKIAAVEDGRSSHDVAADHALANRLRAELADLKAAQDTVLADLRQSLESDWQARAKQMAQAELASARAAWEAETRARIAEINEYNAANIEQSRRTWQAELDSSLARTELEGARHLEQERERWRKESDARLTHAEREAKASEAERLAAEDKLRLLASKGETYERARSEFEADLAKAKAAWKESESARLAEAEAQWQLKATALQSEAQNRLRKEFEGDLVKVRKAWIESEAVRLAEVEATWRARTEQAQAEAGERAKEADLVLAKAQSEWKALEQARLAEAQAAWQQQSVKSSAEVRARAEKEMQVALETAQRAWKASEVARFASAEARWREESSKLIADARAQDGEKSGDDAQLNRLQVELVTANTALANRDAELAQLRQSLDEAGDSARKQLETAVSQARRTWNEEEAARLAAAEQQWRERSARELAELQTQHKASASDEATELNRLRDEAAAAKAQLVERESELMRVRSAAQVESERQRLEGEARLVEAKNAWSAEEKSRIDAIEQSWREQAEAQAERVSRAEKDQPAPEAQAAAADQPRDSVELLKLRDQLERLKSKMAIREVELAQARATADQARARLTGEPIDLLPRQHSDRVLISTGRNRTINTQKAAKRMPYRDIGIVAAVAVVVFLLYPHITSLLPYEWTDSSYSEDTEPPPKPATAAKPAVVIRSEPTDVIVRSANVRSTPSKTATLISTLAADVQVRTIERNGNWTHIEFTSSDAKKQDGWVYNTNLKSLSDAAPAPATETTLP